MRPSSAAPPHGTPPSSSCALASPSCSTLTVRCHLLRVHHQLRAALGVPRSQVIDLLEWWTAQPGYIAAIAAGGMRRNLDGSEAGEIGDEHRAHAEKQLKATR